MKRLYFLLLVILALSCSKFDDSEIWDKLHNHESRITELEKLCKEMNAEIIKLQTVVTALESNDYIVNVAPLVTGDGYTFVFKSGKSVVVYNGKDGTNGTNGTTPQIGVRQDVDGFYYWTVNGEWLIVDGNKVRASATDGTNGITPQFKIENDNWLVSYDNGNTWEILGKATGNNGLNGENGDSFFKGVYIEDSCVSFILNDGEDTVIKIPFYSAVEVVVENNVSGQLHKRITNEQKRQSLSLTVTGEISIEDMEFINTQMLALENLDIHECKAPAKFLMNPFQETLINRTIRSFHAPQISKTDEACHYLNCSYATNLEKITISQDSVRVYTSFSPWKLYPVMVPNLKEIEYTEGVKLVRGSAGYVKKVTLPSTTERVTYELMITNSETKQLSEIYSYATTPPSVGYSESEYVWREKSFQTPTTHIIIYVPKESVELYKEANGWCEYADSIFPIP